MESAFGPVLAKITMVERDFIPNLGEIHDTLDKAC